MVLLYNALWLVPVSVFIGGLVGSPHCLSMCGPIVLNFAHQRASLIAYQCGRMLTYTLAGALLGAFGDRLLGSSRPPWLASLSLLFIAALLLLNGYRALSGKALHFAMPTGLSQLSAHVWRSLRLARWPKELSAAVAGALTVFLPCGHLYSFLIGAVATGAALRGAIYMFAFWLGSAPLLSVSGRWLQRILQPKIRNGQRWAGAFLVVAGLLSVLAFSARVRGLDSDASASTEEHCH